MYRISADTGGTFTDVVVTSGSGQLVLGKALTTPARSFGGLSSAIERAAEQLGVSFRRLVSETVLLVYGTTRATNAIVEHKTARTALLATEGFRDTLIYRNGGKLNSAQLTPKIPPPYIPRRLTLEIPERIDAEGGIVTPLDVDAARRTLLRLKRLDIEAIAVSLLWSIVNPVHERRLGSLIEEILPDIPYTLSADLNPVIREYPRTSSTAIDASLKPLMQRHLRDLRTDLVAAGFNGELLISASSGGVMYVEDMATKPIYMAKSGPAMAPLAAIAYTQAEAIDNDAIVVDSGGTTFDISLIRAGTIKYTRETWLGPQLIGTLLGLATVDVRSIGAGGGSIASVDAGGLLRVGPRSAGSVPGPACYGAGGTEPTVTDSAVVLGYIDPDHFLGGRMKLDRAAAENAVDGIAVKLGKTRHESAAAILRLASESMIKAIEDITVNDGVHPADSVLVAGGGAAGLNILAIARSLGCKKVLLPKTAGAMSATGGQFSDIAIDFSGSAFVSTLEYDVDKVIGILRDNSARASAFEDGLKVKGISSFTRQLFVQARYERQQFEMEIELPIGWGDTPEDKSTLHRIYDAQCLRLYAFSRPEASVEATNWRLRVVAHLARPNTSWPDTDQRQPAIRKAPIYFDGHGLIDAVIYDGTSLPLGIKLAGPAIIEEPTTTIVVEPGVSGHLSRNGNYIFTFGAGDA